MFDEHVSPELALVDPELGAKLRAAHVPPCTVGRAREPATAPAVAPAAASAIVPAGVPATAPAVAPAAAPAIAPVVAPAVAVSPAIRPAAAPAAAPAVVPAAAHATVPAVVPAAAHATVPAIAPVVGPAPETPAAPSRGNWRPRPLELVAATALVVLLGAAFLPSPNPPTFAAPVQHGEIVLAWPEHRTSDVYLLQILDGRKTVYERRLAEPHLDEVFALVDGRRYRWRVFVASGRPAAGSEPIARGSFVLGG